MAPRGGRCRAGRAARVQAAGGVPHAVLDGLQQAYDRALVLTGRHGQLFAPPRFAAWLAGLRTGYWNIHAERVDVGHTAERTREEAARCTLGYLAAYANGVAPQRPAAGIEDDPVVFSYKDYRDHDRVKTARVPALEFIDRFLIRVLPRYLRHIRNYGFLAPNQRGKQLPLIRQLLGLPAPGRGGGRGAVTGRGRGSGRRRGASPAVVSRVPSGRAGGNHLAAPDDRPDHAKAAGPAAAVPATLPVTRGATHDAALRHVAEDRAARRRSPVRVHGQSDHFLSPISRPGPPHRHRFLRRTASSRAAPTHHCLFYSPHTDEC